MVFDSGCNGVRFDTTCCLTLRVILSSLSVLKRLMSGLPVSFLCGVAVIGVSSRRCLGRDCRAVGISPVTVAVGSFLSP